MRGMKIEWEGWIFVSKFKSIICTLRPLIKGDEDFQMRPLRADEIFL